MAVKHANTLSTDQFDSLIRHVSTKTYHPERDNVMVYLSYKAGLRSCEIAGLEWVKNVLNPEGRLRNSIFIGSDIAKNGKERNIPINTDLRRVLEALRDKCPNEKRVIYSPREDKEGLTSNSVTVWFHRLYDAIRFIGCSSHSGRRTFCTRASQKANLMGNSLKDVQSLMGHARLETTEQYIDYSDKQQDLVNAI